MDKLNLALLGVDDNSARISAVDKALRSLISSRTESSVRSASDGSFGTVKSGGVAVVAYDGVSECELWAGNKRLWRGTSPAFVKFDADAELTITGGGANARALILGG